MKLTKKHIFILYSVLVMGWIAPGFGHAFFITCSCCINVNDACQCDRNNFTAFDNVVLQNTHCKCSISSDKSLKNLFLPNVKKIGKEKKDAITLLNNSFEKHFFLQRKNNEFTLRNSINSKFRTLFLQNSSFLL